VLLTEAGWKGPNETEKSESVVAAFKEEWLSDARVESVMPFLLSANNGTPFSNDGWPWVKLIDGRAQFTLQFNTTRELRCGLRIGGSCLKTDDEPAAFSRASVSISSIFGIGVYTDTPGSPSFDDQLDTALDLVGRGGWVTIFLCTWRTHTTSCVNRSTTHDPASSAMLQAAYNRGLNVVARIGNPYTIRDHADDSTHSSFRQLGSGYARLVASLPAPPVGGAPLYVQVGNELNACNEWHCSDAPNVTMSGGEMAMEVAAFARDVAISLIPLRNGSVRSTLGTDAS
jgi:hypothetical protein